MTPPKLQAITIRGKTLYEIVENRNYTRKVFLGPRFPANQLSRRFHFHTAHIHYKDPGGAFLPINTTLLWKDTTRTYEQNKASYHCSIPEYADGWFSFFNSYEGANHTIKAKPVCNHVKGALLPDLHDGFGHDNGSVLYKDCFAPGIDLRAIAYWGGLRKVITINKQPADISQGLHFDFELDIPSDFKVLDNQSSLAFTGRTLRLGNNGKYSFFKNARIWDSGTLKQPVEISLFTTGGKLYLRKTISKQILEKAEYPLYTDHPTNYYVGAGDGYINKLGIYESWDTVHDSATGVAFNGETTGTCETTPFAPFTSYIIRRMFLPINTSGIGTGVEILSATLRLFIHSKVDGDNDGDDWFNVVQATQASTSELVAADFNKCGAVDDPPEGAARIDVGDIVVSDYNDWEFDDTGIGWIVKDGWTKLGLREGHDAIDEACAGEVRVDVRFSEYANTGSDPYLDVTTGAPPSNPYPTSLLRKDVIHGYNCFMQAYVNAKRAGLDPLKLPDGTTF